MPATPPTQGIDPLDPVGAVALMRQIQAQAVPQKAVSDSLIKQANDPSLIYDPASDLAAIRAKSALAGSLPTSADIEAQQAALKDEGAQYLLQQLQGIQVPQEGMLEQPNLPQLQLPDQPQTARPKVSSLAQLLAIGAGFAHPQGAGQFNAAALEGAIRGAEEENQRRQQHYKNDLAGRAMLYDASMTAARERERIVEANRDTALRNTVATTDHQMMLAKARTEQFMAHGAAESSGKFAEKYDPVLKAQAEVKAMFDEIATKGTASAQRVRSISELLTALPKEDAAGSSWGKDLFDTIMRNAQATRQLEVGHKNALELEAARAAHEMGRTQYVQGQETNRANAGLTNQVNIKKLGADLEIRRMQIGKTLGDPEALKQSRALQADTEKYISHLRVAATEAFNELQAALAGSAIGGVTGPPAVKAAQRKLEAMQQAVTAEEDRLRKEQRRAKLFDPTGPARGKFDGNTGKVSFP